MKTLFVLISVVALFISNSAIAQTIVEEEFIVEGQPTTTAPVTTVPVVVTPGTTVVTTTPIAPVVVVPAEQEVYVGMGAYHVKTLLGPPTYVEKFRRYTRRHHGIYDEVWTYTSPTGTMVLYIKERRVQKVEYH